MACLTCSYAPAICSRDPSTGPTHPDLCPRKARLCTRGFQTICSGLDKSSPRGKDHKKSSPSVFVDGYLRNNGSSSSEHLKWMLDSRDHMKWVCASSSVEGGGNGYGGININGGGSNNGGGSGWGKGNFGNGGEDRARGGLLGMFLQGWRRRVEADPQFPFKVLMEEVVGVSSNVVGDMASRPNFGLNELDFVFCTLVVGSMMNFTLMYMLAPTSVAGGGALPGVFSCCPPSHMFEIGPYGVLERLGTFVYKGTLFSVAGFGAGLVGTALSNTLIGIREKLDPKFVSPNKPPPPLLNATTWALHMAFSSNLRYQTLNGIEFLLAKGLPPIGFKASVIVLRCLNNVLGGMSFVLLARLTGSQKVEESSSPPKEEKLLPSPKLESVDVDNGLQHNETS